MKNQVNKIASVLIFIALCGQLPAQTVIRGPYLQSLTPFSIKIKWRTNLASNSRVHYGTTPGNLNLTEDVTGSVTDHTVKLSNLQPNTKYYYSVGTTTQVLAGPSTQHYFVTAPPFGTVQPFRVWGIGDFGKANQGQIDVMNSYVNYTGSTHTDLWLWMGDNAYNDGTDAEYQTKVFDIYKNIMTYMPFYPCPGNHDYNSVCAIPCFSNPTGHSGPYLDIVDVPTMGEAGGVASTRELYYSFDYANVHFISLNSELGSLIPGYDWCGTYSSSNFTGSPLHTWLISDLNANTKPWTVVYFHQPPYTKGSHDSDDIYELYMTAMRQNFIPIFEQYGVDVVLCGHSHVYERSYLLRGHYGTSSTFNNSYKVDGRSGKASLSEEYVKYLDGVNPNRGTVYVVCGNSGSSEPGAAINHPAMYYGHDGYGSFVMDFNGLRLDAKYLKSDGTIGDEFTIIKTSTNITSNVSAAICPGESYFAGGANRTTSGTYYDTIVVPNGPDTIIVTQLTVKQAFTANRTVNICSGSSYYVGGANQTTSGLYTDVYVASNGCDSTVQTQLNVSNLVAQTVNATICSGESYFAGGALQTTAGSYLDTLPGIGGCDTVLTTELSIQPAQSASVDVKICIGESYFAGGKNQNTSGTYFDTLQTAFGCDSFLTTMLTVNPLPASPTITKVGSSLTVPAVYISYQWFKDNVAIPGANLNVLIVSSSGDYTVQVGDASGCKSVSDVYSFVPTGIQNFGYENIKLFPNPTGGEVTILFGRIIRDDLSITVYNVLGEEVYRFRDANFNDEVIRLNIDNLDAGIYIVRIQSGEIFCSKSIARH